MPAQTSVGAIAVEITTAFSRFQSYKNGTL